jgi:hypothetical protein
MMVGGSETVDFELRLHLLVRKENITMSEAVLGSIFARIQQKPRADVPRIVIFSLLGRPWNVAS